MELKGDKTYSLLQELHNSVNGIVNTDHKKKKMKQFPNLWISDCCVVEDTADYCNLTYFTVSIYH